MLTNQELRLTNNKLKQLPFSLIKLSNLYILALTGNPLEFPFSYYINETHPAKLFQFIDDISHGVEKWPQMKLIVLGHGGAGKVFIFRLQTKLIDNTS